MADEKTDFQYIINKAKRLFGDEFLLLKNAILMEYNKQQLKDYSKGYNAGRKKRNVEVQKR